MCYSSCVGSINVISRDNSWGLSVDYQIMYSVLSPKHKVFFSSFDGPPTNRKYNVNIHSELVGGRLFRAARLNLFLPNPEWTLALWLNSRGRFRITLCKTYETQRIFDALGWKTTYIGFTSQDQYKPTKKRKEFIHIAGNSRFKNTEQVIEAWNRNPEWPALYVFNVYEDLSHLIRGENIVYHFGRLPNLKEYQNRCMFAIQPSKSEGFGHVLYEALSTDCVLLTTNAPPMSEIKPAILIDAFREGEHHLGTLYGVTVEAIEKTVNDVLDTNIITSTRYYWEENDKRFRKRFSEVINQLL